MAKERVSVPSFFGGVSTQPPTIRRPDQVTEAINTLITVNRGTEKRPPFDFLSQYDEELTLDGNSFYHWIDRDPSERYVVRWNYSATEPLTIINVAGLATNKGLQEVYYTTEALAYLTEDDDGNPITSNNLKMLTIGDTTFVVNTSRTVATLDDGDADNFGIAMFNADFEGTFPSPEEFPTGETGEFVKADRPHNRTNNNPSLPDEILAGYYKNNTFAVAWTGYDVSANVQTYEPRWVTTAERLPDRFMVFEHTGSYEPDEIQLESPAYVEVKRSSVFGPLGWRRGVDVSGMSEPRKMKWSKFPQPEISDCYLDPETLPIKITRRPATSADVSAYGVTLGDLIFVGELIDWSPRFNGDNETNPLPSFVNNKLADLALFQDRLVFSSGEHIIMSQSGDFFNFFPDDYTDLIDSDPIDISTNTEGVTIVQHIVAYDRTLLIFADGNRQFLLRFGETLSPLNTGLVALTSYRSSRSLKPRAIGTQLYFVSDSGNRPTVYEYFLEAPGESDSTVAFNISLHAEGYLPTIPQQIVGDEEATIVGLVYPNELKIYRYHWAGQDRLQSAWCTWDLSDSDTIETAEIFDDKLYLLLRQSQQQMVTPPSEITFDSQVVLNTAAGSETSLSDSLTIAVDTNYLCCFVHRPLTDADPTDVTVGDQSLTLVDKSTDADNNGVWFYEMFDPPTGAQTVEVTMGTGTGWVAGFLGYKGVASRRAINDSATPGSVASSLTVGVTAVTGDTVLSGFSSRTDDTATLDPATVERYNVTNDAGTSSVRSAVLQQTAASSGTIEATITPSADRRISAIAVSLVPEDGEPEEQTVNQWLLIRASLFQEPKPTGMPYSPLVDLRYESESLTYDIINDETDIVIPFVDFSDSEFIVVFGPKNDDSAAGTWLPVLRVEADTPSAGQATAVIKGKASERDSVYVGRLYPMEVELSRPYLRDREGTALDIGITDITSVVFNHLNTGFYQFVARYEDNEQVDAFNSNTVGGHIFGASPLNTGRHKALVFGEAGVTRLFLRNSTPVPCNISNYEFILDYHERDR